MSAHAGLAAVLLAAGRSERFGTPKLSIRLEGETLRHRSARSLVEAGLFPVMAVLRDPAEASDLPEGMLHVIGAADGGQGDSLAAGVRALSQHPDAARSVGLIVALADQPLALPALRAVVDAFGADPGAVVGAAHNGRVVPPVAFPRSLWEDLMALTGEAAGRSILSRLGAEVRHVSPGGPWHMDVDTPADVARLRSAVIAQRPGRRR